MSSSRKQARIEDLVRRRGIPPKPTVDVLASEIRSCLVAGCPPLVEPEPDGLLGGIVVMWEYSLPLGDVQEFHKFLKKEEVYITESVKKLGAYYRGTYMLYGPGDPRYRTIWAYKSLEIMCKVWSPAHLKTASNLYKVLRQLRAFWLRDPNRSEARWVPARHAFDPDHDHGDGFAKLTLEAFKLHSARRPARRG
jgi:hypothetical protein